MDLAGREYTTCLSAVQSVTSGPGELPDNTGAEVQCRPGIPKLSKIQKTPHTFPVTVWLQLLVYVLPENHGDATYIIVLY